MIRTRPCTQPRERTVYTAVHGPCVWSIYDPNTAVYPVPGLFTARVHGCSRSSLRPVYTAVYGRERTGTWPCAGHEPYTRACLRLRPMNAALLRPVYTAVYRPCTRPFTGRVYGPFMTRTRPCTLYRGCLRPVYTAVHGGYGPGTRPYMIRTRPCTRPCTAPTVVFTACVHGRVRP